MSGANSILIQKSGEGATKAKALKIRSPRFNARGFVFGGGEKRKALLSNPVSQSKLVECATAQRLVQRRLSTWLAPCNDESLLSRITNKKHAHSC
jgi:hypothetical protein